jgi:signal recognition particle receptor subunit beta
MDQHKIIFTGPSGAGKTTAVNVLSDIPTVTTETWVSDATGARGRTTAPVDYGILKVGDAGQIHLYGTPGQDPGQDPIESKWDALTDGGIGLVLLLDNARPDPFADMRSYFKAFQSFIDQTKVIIGVTRMDVKPSPSIEDYYKQLWTMGRNAPIFEVDARRRDDIALLVQALLYSLDPGLSG